MHFSEDRNAGGMKDAKVVLSFIKYYSTLGQYLIFGGHED